MREELLETEAVEMPVLEGEDGELAEPAARPLPATVERQAELSAWKGEARTVAIAAAGGIVAGAATVALARATRGASSKRPAKRQKAKERPIKVLASRSFLVDVHLVDR
jgi:hypothetical protein